MTAPVPTSPPLDGAACQAWAQPTELGADIQPLLPDDTWCFVLAAATDVLWAATGRRWRGAGHTETVTLDPVPHCAVPQHARYPVPWSYRIDPTRTDRVRLPRDDVTAVTAVTVAGAAFTEWRLDGAWLIRTDGLGWTLSIDTRITYTFGHAPPAGGRLAVLTLASELGKWLAGKPTQLPARVTSVTRQGISFTVLDDLQILQDGLTGMTTVDMWIMSVNPHRTRQETTVWSPDVAAVTARRA